MSNENYFVGKAQISILQSKGFKAYFVGGCVRDNLLGLAPKDYDIATNATPQQILETFPLAKVVGEKFGVCIYNGIEIATFRKDGIYTDGRRPDSVEFSQLASEDSLRRDFTINAMYFDPIADITYDFHGGQKDLSAGIIRCVGDPNDRFEQDHLRILRAIRFSARLNFAIDDQTKAAMWGCSSKLVDIASERIQQELVQSMSHNGLATMILMNETGIISVLFPELYQLQLDNHAAYNDIMLVAGMLGCKEDPALSFASLLYKLDSQTVYNICNRMTFTNELRNSIMDAIALQYNISCFDSNTPLHKTKRLIRSKNFDTAFRLYSNRVDVGEFGRNHGVCSRRDYLKEIIKHITPEGLNPEPILTGLDLIVMGMTPGPQFKEILRALEDAQLSGFIKNRDMAEAFVETFVKVETFRVK